MTAQSPGTLATPRVEGLYETHLTVASLAVSIPFYRDVVGLELAKVFDDRVAFLWVDDRRKGMLGLWQSGNGPLGLRLHLAFNVSLTGVLASAAALTAQGVRPLGFDNEPLDEPVVIGWMPAVAQYFLDPDGHSIEFIHVLAEEPDDSFGVQPYSRWRGRENDRRA
jgi:lactoylglutathione lyase